MPGHMLSKAAERMVRLRNVRGPRVMGVNSLLMIFILYIRRESVKEWDDTLPAADCIAELFFIPMPDGIGAGDEVGYRPPQEDEAGE